MDARRAVVFSPRRIEDEVPPNEVPGYSEACALGIVRAPSEHPPRLVPGIPAIVAFRLFLAAAVVGAGIVIALAHALANAIPMQNSGLRLLIAAPGVIWFFTILWGFGRVGDRLYAELAAGYATFRPLTARFGIGDERGFELANIKRPWDFRGAWALNQHGEVVAPPDRSMLPPGFYPSPHRPRQLELWTGMVWRGEYREYPPLTRG